MFLVSLLSFAAVSLWLRSRYVVVRRAAPAVVRVRRAHRSRTIYDAQEARGAVMFMIK